jgi:hypothetical protein
LGDRADINGSEEQSAGLGDFAIGSRTSFLLFVIVRLVGFPDLERFTLLGALLRDEDGGGVNGEPADLLCEILSRRLAELC